MALGDSLLSQFPSLEDEELRSVISKFLSVLTFQVGESTN